MRAPLRLRSGHSQGRHWYPRSLSVWSRLESERESKHKMPRWLTMHLSQFKRLMCCISVMAFIVTSLLCYYVTTIGTNMLWVSSTDWNFMQLNASNRHLKLLSANIDYLHHSYHNDSQQNGSSQYLAVQTTNIEISTDHTVTDKLSADRTVTDKLSTDHTVTDKLSTDHTVTDKLSTDHTVTLSTDHTVTDKLSTDHTVTDKLLLADHHNYSSYTLNTPIPKQPTVDTHTYNKDSSYQGTTTNQSSHFKVVTLGVSRHQTTSPPPKSTNSLSTQSIEHTELHTTQQKKKGYILAQKIYEQQTMASGNLFHLQCLARHLQLLVVKPAMLNSILQTPLHQQMYSSMMKFEDTFDIHSWESEANKRGYSPLVDWEDFIENAPRNVIYAQMKYTTIMHVKALKQQGMAFNPHPAGEAYKEGCKFKISGKDMDFLSANGFRVIRKACFNFITGDELTPQQFHEHLLGGHSADDVTVIINEWRGIGETQRVLVKDGVCLEQPFFREMTKPSDRLIKDAERYAAKYLKGSNNYIAIIARFEMAAITHKSENPNDPYEIIPHCVQLVTDKWKAIKSHTGINTTFLATDIGKFGSGSFVHRNYYNHLDDMESFVNEVYSTMTIREWERTFEDIAHTVDTGYIGMLQLVIVTRARCILFMGGGSYQRHALNLYKELHPSVNDQCIYVINKCTNPSRSIDI